MKRYAHTRRMLLSTQSLFIFEATSGPPGGLD